MKYGFKCKKCSEISILEIPLGQYVRLGDKVTVTCPICKKGVAVRTYEPVSAIYRGVDFTKSAKEG